MIFVVDNHVMAKRENNQGFHYLKKKHQPNQNQYHTLFDTLMRR